MKHGPRPIDSADPLCRLDAGQLRWAYAKRELSPVEVAKATLDRAETVQGLFNAFTRIDRASALAAARASEERWSRHAPLSAVDGVPSTIKDIVWVAGWPIGYGSLSTSRVPSPADAPAVARLKGAGVTILGLTTTPEFGWKALTDSPLSGATRNPWMPTLTPGGSSGGAAVAASTGAGVFHLGTDGGGSIRIPSAFTGIVGHKPTYGRVPAYPASAFSPVAHLGPMTRGVDDTRAMLDVISGIDRQDWLQGPGQMPPLTAHGQEFRGAKIGYWTRPPCGTVDPEISATVSAAVERLAQLGAHVEPVDLPTVDTFRGDLLDIFQVIWFSGAAVRASNLSPSARAELDPGLRAIVAAGETFGAMQYVKALGARAEFGRSMEALTSRYDILVSPATSVLPFAIDHEVPPGSALGSWTEWAGFSFPINLSHQPAAVVPCGRSASGLPIGLQIVASRGEDGRVLDYAKAFETAFPCGLD